MTGTVPSEYHNLALASSNEMMDYDSRWVLGRYAEAAWHILQAGHGRLRMGQMMCDAGDFTQAAADWLSAAACFDLATDPVRMREALDRAKKFFEEGRIPPERRDLHEALKEREGQIQALEARLNLFRRGVGRATGQERLAWLLTQVRELPGFPNLHFAIAHVATQLGQYPRALEHLAWAEKFAPDNSDVAALRVRVLIEAGELPRAIPTGRELLTVHPELVHLRLLLAQTIAAQPTAQRSDWEEAVELLRPLTDTDIADRELHLLALALAAILRHGLGHEPEYRRLLQLFDLVAQSSGSVREQRVVNEVRRASPDVFSSSGPNEATPSGTNGRSSAQLDYSAVRRFGELLSLSAA